MLSLAAAVAAAPFGPASAERQPQVAGNAPLVAEQPKQALHPHAAREQGRRGIEFLGLGRLDEAERALRKALEIDPNDDVAIANLGVVLYRQGDYRGAADSFSRVLRDPQRVTKRHLLALMMRGFANARLNRLSQSLADFETAITIAPLNPNGFAGRAMVRLELADHKAALADATVALALGLQDPKVYAIKGKALTALGNEEEGRRFLAISANLMERYSSQGGAPAANTGSKSMMLNF